MKNKESIADMMKRIEEKTFDALPRDPAKWVKHNGKWYDREVYEEALAGGL